MRRAGAALAGAGLALAIARPVAAQPAPPAEPSRPALPDAAHKEAARAHFDRARELHAQKKYLEAAEAYLAAFAEVPMPAFLYNAGQVYRLAGERDKAIDHYRRYLELEPEGEGSSDARAFLEELERERAAATTEGSGAGTTPPAATPPAARDDRPLDPGAGPTAMATPGQADDVPVPGRRLRVAAILSLGVGAIALGAAAGFAFKSRSASDDLSDHRGEWTPSEQDLYRAGEDAERYMMISLGVGVAAVAASGVLYVLSRRAEAPATVVAPTATGAVVSYGASF